MPQENIELDWEHLRALRAVAPRLPRREGVEHSIDSAEGTYTAAEAAARTGDSPRAAQLVRKSIAAYRGAILAALEKQLDWLATKVSQDTPADVEATLERVRSLLGEVKGTTTIDTQFIEKLHQAIGQIVHLNSNLLPDLTLELFNVPGLHWLVPYPPEAGKLALASVRVRNVGQAKIDTPFDTELSVDNKVVRTWTFNPHGEGINKPPTPLGPGGSRLYDHGLTLAPGLHTLRWVVDTKNQIEESDESETSNCLEVQETWYQTADLPDLLIEDIWHEGPLLIGAEQLWKVKVANRGKTAAVGDCNVSMKGDGAQFAFFTLSYLGAGQSVVLQAGTNPTLIPGQVTITAIVYNMNAELDKQNNQLTKTFEIGCVDLEVKDIQVSIIKADATRFDITIANNGAVDAPFPFKVQLRAPGIADVLLDCPGIQAGGTAQLQHVINHPIGGSIGDCMVIVEADFSPGTTPVYTELNTDNNTKVLDYRARRVVLIVIDGLRPDKLDSYLKSEMVIAKNSGLRELGLGGPAPSHKAEVLKASTVFPSTTLTANASLVTGVYPAKHGIAATSYYKADKDVVVNWGSKELGPTIYGFYDKFGDQNWAGVINGWQYTNPSSGGLNKELALSGIRTIYNEMSDYKYPSQVFYHHYSNGAGYYPPMVPAGFADQLDGWDVPTKFDLICDATISGNDDVSFFEHFDLPCSERAKWWIENLPDKFPFPRLLTIYFASVDHACHVRGLSENVGNITIDYQRKYLLQIDQVLYNVVQALKTRFPVEFQNTVFVIVADHGHDTVDRNKIISHDFIYHKLIWGPFEISWKTIFDWVVHIGFEGTSAQLYVRPSYDQATREEVVKKLLGNLCRNLPLYKQIIHTVIGRLPSDPVYREYLVEQGQPSSEPNFGWVLKSKPLTGTLDIIQMLNNTKRSGDIVLLANQKNLYQFTDDLPHATNLSIPLTDIQNMRIPFSEVFNTASTHGSVETLEIPLLFVGKPFAQNHQIQKANIVDVAPTILSMLGLPTPPYMDGRPLLDPSLEPVQYMEPYMGRLLAPDAEMRSYTLAISVNCLTIFTVISEATLEKGLCRAERGMVTVITENLGAEVLDHAVLSIDPETEHRREVQASLVEQGRLAFSFDSRVIADGKHCVVVEGTTKTGRKVSSQGADFTIDNSPPSLVRIDSVMRVDSVAEGRSRGGGLIQVQATVVDDAGISLVELYDGLPGDGGRLIGATQRIDNNRCTIVGNTDSTGKDALNIIIKACDMSGNYRVDRVMVKL